MDKPLLIIDVDGVLLPSIRFTQKKIEKLGYRYHPVHGLMLNRMHGVWLNELNESGDYELVWGTYWNYRANHVIAPALGLPELPVIRLGRHDPVGWKYDKIAEYAGDRPFAWIDDEFSLRPERHDAFVRQHASDFEHRLLLPIDGDVGLTEADVDGLRYWARQHANR